MTEAFSPDDPRGPVAARVILDAVRDAREIPVDEVVRRLLPALDAADAAAGIYRVVDGEWELRRRVEDALAYSRSTVDSSAGAHLVASRVRAALSGTVGGES